MTRTAAPDILKIKKYPNRRFYDATRSRHVTLDELHQLVRAGHQIEVTDSDGRDITNIVLTQILLEHDPPKLDLFPASLLHQAVQANQVMVRRFIDEYFSKAMDLFLNSRKQFDAFLAQSGLSPLQPVTPFDWAKRFLTGFGQGPANESQAGTTPIHQSPRGPEAGVASLRAEVEALRAELGRIKPQKKRREGAKQAKTSSSRTRKSRRNRE